MINYVQLDKALVSVILLSATRTHPSHVSLGLMYEDARPPLESSSGAWPLSIVLHIAKVTTVVSSLHHLDEFMSLSSHRLLLRGAGANTTTSRNSITYGEKWAAVEDLNAPVTRSRDSAEHYQCARNTLGTCIRLSRTDVVDEDDEGDLYFDPPSGLEVLIEFYGTLACLR